MDSFEYRRELSSRVNALVEVHEFETGATFKFAAIQAAMLEAGLSLSRQRWSYLRHGSAFPVTDPELLGAVARFFGEDPTFLTDLTVPISEDFQTRLDHVVRLRRAEVQKAATRALGRLDPELAESLIRAIEESADPGDLRRS